MNLLIFSIFTILISISQAADIVSNSYISSGLKYIGNKTKGIFNSDVPMIAKSGLQWLSGFENNTGNYLNKSQKFYEQSLEQLDKDKIEYLKDDSITYGYYWTGEVGNIPELSCYKEARCILVIFYHKFVWGYSFNALHPYDSKNRVDNLKAIPRKEGERIEYTFEIYGKKQVSVSINQLFWFIKVKCYDGYWAKAFGIKSDIYKQYNFLKDGYPEGLIDIKVSEEKK